MRKWGGEYMDENRILKLRLENTIEYYENALNTRPKKETMEMLELLKECHDVVSNIVMLEDDLK